MRIPQKLISIMKPVLLGFVVLGLTTPVLAQGARVNGRVLDEDGAPIEGVTVTLANPNIGPPRTVTTNKKGEWAVLGLESGTWNIDFEADGYVIKKGSIQLGQFETPKPIEVNLERAGPPPELLEAAEQGDAAYKAGRFAEAREHYQTLLTLRPDLAATLHIQIARCYKEEGNVEKEVEHLEAALDTAPDDHTVRTLLAMEVIEMGETDRGLELLGAVDESAISSPEVFYNIGVSLLNKDKRSEAVEFFTKAVAVDPSYTDAYYQRGLTLYGLQEVDEAKKDFEKVLELAPDGPQAETARKVLEQPESP